MLILCGLLCVAGAWFLGAAMRSKLPRRLIQILGRNYFFVNAIGHNKELIQAVSGVFNNSCHGTSITPLFVSE